jgi:TfoX/Sxy family transcriptional regulator of competence genes
MATNAMLTDRVHKMLARQPGLTSDHMFGGMVFSVQGNICCGVIDDQLLVRVQPDKYEESLDRPHTSALFVGDHPKPGYVLVAPQGYAEDEDMAAWIEDALAYAPAEPAEDVSVRHAPTMNPWLGIMLQPRRTIRAIVDRDSVRSAILIAFLWGALTTYVDIGTSSWLTERAVGGLFGIIVVHIIAGIFWIIASVFDGEATLKEGVTVFAWTSIPAIYAAVLQIAFEALSWQITGASYMWAPAHPVLGPLTYVLRVSVWALYAWQFVVLVLCFAEVNRFSVWRSLAILLLPAILILSCFLYFTLSMFSSF